MIMIVFLNLYMRIYLLIIMKINNTYIRMKINNKQFIKFILLISMLILISYEIKHSKKKQN
jgi:hypothetical protein